MRNCSTAKVLKIFLYQLIIVCRDAHLCIKRKYVLIDWRDGSWRKAKLMLKKARRSAGTVKLLTSSAASKYRPFRIRDLSSFLSFCVATFALSSSRSADHDGSAGTAALETPAPKKSTTRLSASSVTRAGFHVTNGQTLPRIASASSPIIFL